MYRAGTEYRTRPERRRPRTLPHRRPGTPPSSGVNKHATSVPFHGPAGPAAPLPMLASPPNHGGGTSVPERRVPPELPLLCIANPAASPARRTCGPFSRADLRRSRAAARRSAVSALDQRRFGVAGSGRFARAWERRPRWTANRGGGRRFRGAPCGARPQLSLCAHGHRRSPGRHATLRPRTLPCQVLRRSRRRVWCLGHPRYDACPWHFC